MFKWRDSGLETESKQLKSENETFKREISDREPVIVLWPPDAEVFHGFRPRPASSLHYRALPLEAIASKTKGVKGVKGLKGASFVGSETAGGSTDSVLQRQLNDAIQQLSETRKQLLNVEDQLTVVKQVTAATQRRELVQEGAYENLLTDAYKELRFDPTLYTALRPAKHIGCIKSSHFCGI